MNDSFPKLGHGDFTPYLYRSDNRGRTWQSISGDLPERTIIWAVEQDHVNPDLLFLAAEFGLHVSVNGGQNWHRLSKGVPTISFRDLKLHRRDDDLVGASFGRGFYVLDDYSPLRTLSEESLAAEAVLFPVRDAWRYVPFLGAQAVGQPTLGSAAYRSDNPPFGATFTYHLAEPVLGLKKQRLADEKEQRKAGGDIAVPDIDALWTEHMSTDPTVVLIVRNDAGEPVRRLAAEHEVGLHRTTWDLRLAAPQPVKLDKPEFTAPWDTDPVGPLVAPGSYSVELAISDADGLRTVGERQTFAVKPTPDTVDKAGADDAQAFRERTAALATQVFGMEAHVERTKERVRHIRATITGAAIDDPALSSRLEDLHQRLASIDRELSGDKVLDRLSEPETPSLGDLVGRVAHFHWKNTQRPTGTQVSSIERAAAAYGPLPERFSAVLAELSTFVDDLDAAGASWTKR